MNVSAIEFNTARRRLSRQVLIKKPERRIFTAIFLVSSLHLMVGCTAIEKWRSAPAESVHMSVASENDRIQRHAYVGLGLGVSHLEPEVRNLDDVAVNDRVAGAGQVTLGVDLSRQVAVELHSADLGSAGFSPSGRINYHIHGGSVLFYGGKNRHRFKRRGLTAYGRLGAGYLDNSSVGDRSFIQDNATHMLLGVGLEYMWQPGLGVRAEAISFEEDVQYAQLGLIYRTGRNPGRQPVELVQAPDLDSAPILVPAIKVAESALEKTCQEFTETLHGVNFRTGSADLTPQAKTILAQLASRLNECDLNIISISAHTDSVGTMDYNQRLSVRRARSVANYLTSKGVDATRLNALAFGETRPIAPNTTPTGRSLNRRVELEARQ